jgi:5-(aminomethyl)-3-furanmethanol phosphate kinase
MDELKVVVKVGGSLFDWPKLGSRLGSWLKTFPSSKILMFPGGGPAADLIREYDRLHGLGEETAHWLALRALSLNARFLAAVLRPQCRPSVIVDLPDAETVWKQTALPILDPFVFFQEDENRPDHLDHSWSTTGDSLAARVALQLGARSLVLLKSAPIPSDWMKAKQGIVDSCFEKIVSENDSFLEVSAINFRDWRG